MKKNAVSGSLFIAVIKYLTEGNGRTYLCSKLRVCSTMAAKGWGLEQETAGYIASAVREQKVDRMWGVGYQGTRPALTEV